MITIEIIEQAAKALEKHIKKTTYEWSDKQFETWWNKDPRFVEETHTWGWFTGTDKEKCLYEAQILLNAAQEPRSVSYETLEHHTDEDPAMTGWFIVYRDPDGTSYDAIGPFDSFGHAAKVQKETREKG